MLLTPDKFFLMEQSLAKDTKDMPDDVGVSVALWRLRALVAGYKWALNKGYGPDNG